MSSLGVRSLRRKKSAARATRRAAAARAVARGVTGSEWWRLMRTEPGATLAAKRQMIAGLL